MMIKNVAYQSNLALQRIQKFTCPGGQFMNQNETCAEYAAWNSATVILLQC